MYSLNEPHCCVTARVVPGSRLACASMITHMSDRILLKYLKPDARPCACHMGHMDGRWP